MVVPVRVRAAISMCGLTAGRVLLVVVLLLSMEMRWHRKAQRSRRKRLAPTMVMQLYATSCAQSARILVDKVWFVQRACVFPRRPPCRALLAVP